MQSLTRFFKRIGSDIASGKNLEAYAVTLIAFLLAVIGVIDDAVPDDLKLAAILAALGLLVLKSTEPDNQVVDLDAVLLDRQSYGSFRDFIADAKELWVYGPSAVNALRNAGEIKMEVLDRGGQVRFLLQDPQSQIGMDVLTMQLDKVYDLSNDIKTSMATLDKMASWKMSGTVEYGVIPYSPGFSLTVVDANGKNGRLVIEFYGYQNELINDRMHIVVTRQQSQYWFEYWAKQFDIMWEARRPLP
jgi:hypothetical protein